MADSQGTQRVRFEQCRLDAINGGGFRATVDLSHEGGSFTGTADRPTGEAADAWAAAQACLTALGYALGFDRGTVELRDVTAFRIDEDLAVAVSLRTGEGSGRRRLFGLCRAEEDRGRAGALAVLSATNRFFGDG